MRCFIRPLVVVICLSLVAGRVSAASGDGARKGPAVKLAIRDGQVIRGDVEDSSRRVVAESGRR